MKSLSYIFLLIICFSCADGAKETLLENSEATQTKSSVSVSDSLQSIVDSLSLYNTIDDEAVGYSGMKSETYLCFERLKAKASEEELIRLTGHDSPIVRGYSFLALVENDSPKVKEVMLNHLKDTVIVQRFSGCTGYPEQLNDFLFSVIAPNCLNIDCNRLPKKDLDEIKSKMNNP